MARVNIYTGTPNVIPIYEQYDESLVLTIKEEPRDETEPLNDEQSVEDDSTNDVKIPADSIASTSNELQYEVPEEKSKSKPSKSRSRRRKKKRKQTNLPDKVASLPDKKPSWKNRIGTRELGGLISTPEVVSKLRSKIEKQIPVYICDICSSPFPSELALKKHRHAYDNMELMCYVCNTYIENSEKFLTHQLAEHPRPTSIKNRTLYQCDYCVLNFLTKCQIRQHIHHFHNPFDKKIKLFSQAESLPANTPDTSVNNNSNNRKRKRDETVFTISSKLKEENRDTDGVSSKRRSMVISDTVNQALGNVDDIARAPTPGVSLRGNRDSNEASVNRNERQSRIVKYSLNQRMPEDRIGHAHQLPQRNQNKMRSSTLSQPESPLVKIYAIPKEVEALLGDLEGTSIKRMRVTAVDDTIGNDNEKRRSSRTNPNAQVCTHSLSTHQTFKNDNSQSQTIPRRRIESSSFVSYDLPETPRHTPTVKLDSLQRRYDCRDCHIILEKINLPSDQNDEFPKMRHETPEYSEQDFESVQRPIGLELRNLEIALKKLEVPTDSADQCVTGETTIPSENSDLNIEESFVASKEVSSTTQSRSIYRSSACRTRFTTKRKLIYHYLCFHTNSSNLECGVCRTKCSSPARLKRHLSLHCIKIIASKQDRSPIDSKVPCEAFKKKYMCTGCRKHFWLSSCLKKHAEHCRFVKNKVKEKKKMTRKSADAAIIETTMILENEDIDDTIAPRIITRSVKKVPDRVETVDVAPIPQSSTPEIKIIESDVASKSVLSQDEPEKSSDVIPVPCQNIVESAVTSKSTESQDEPTKSTNLIPVPYRWWIDNPPLSRKKQYPCVICNTHFQSADNLQEHMRKFVPREVQRCDKCGTDFPSKALFAHHQKSSHTPESLSYRCHCPICNQGFPAKKYLRCHTLHIHQGMTDRSYEQQDSYLMIKKCHICRLRFKSAKRLYEHGMYYFDEEVYNCKICNLKFFGQHRAHQHNKLVHYSKETREIYSYNCKICQEGFITRGHLRSHVLHNHSEQESYEMEKEDVDKKNICRSCDERFTTLDQLHEHEDEFSNDGHHKCDHCDRQCRTQSLLIQHQNLSHSNSIAAHQRKCKICAEVLPSKTSWLSHIKHLHTTRFTRSSEFCVEIYLAPIISIVETLQDSDVNSTSNLNEQSPIEIIEVHEVEGSQQEGDSSSQIPEIGEVGEMLCDAEPDIIIEPIPPSHIEYTCAICDEKFLSMSELKTHGYTHTSNSFGGYDKSKVIDISEKGNSLNEELILSMEERQPLLYIPNESSENYGVTFNHNNGDSSAPLFISDICSVQLEDYEKLTNSENVCQENILYTNPVIELPQEREFEKIRCSVCQIEFNGYKSLENHQIRYSNTGPHMCEKCGRRFSGLKAYRTHTMKHQRRENSGIPVKHYCEVCDEVFGTSDSKRMHFAHLHKLLLTMDGSQIEVPCGSQLPTNTTNENPESNIIANLTSQSNNMNIPMQCQLQMEQTIPTNSLSNLQERENGFIEEVDLTEDEDDGEIDNPLAALSTPTVSYRDGKSSNVRLESSTNFPRIYLPLTCTLCNLKLESMEVLIHHLENVHHIDVSAKNFESLTRMILDGKISANNCSSLADSNCRVYDGKSQTGLMASGGSLIERISGIFKSHCCRICNINFANEQSLITHFNNAHTKMTNEPIPLSGTSCSKQENSSIARFISTKISMNEESSKPLKDLSCGTSFASQKIRTKLPAKDSQVKSKRNIVLSKIDPTEAQKMLNLIPLQASQLARFHRTYERNKKTENSDQNLLR